MSQKRSRTRNSKKKKKQSQGKIILITILVFVLFGATTYAGFDIYKKINKRSLETQSSKVQTETAKMLRLEINESDTIVSLSKKIASQFPKLNMTQKQIIDKLNNREYISALQQKYTFIPDIVKDTNIAYPLEGLLRPLTYEYYETDTFDTIIDKPLNAMKQFYDQYNPKLQSKGVSFYEALTLASITNAEVPSNDKENMALVAQVFYNRLNANIGLGSDATLAYHLQKRELTNNDFANAQNSQYNTRIHKGLTPTPIQFVTDTAMDAIVNPKANDNLYFLTGTCKGREDFAKFYYAKTYEEHQKNIQKHMEC